MSATFTSTSDGIKLDQSILWFDAYESGELSFLSSALRSKIKTHSQVITSEDTAKLLTAKRRRFTATVCQYNRPFSIGRLRMELLPSGTLLGGASLYIENENDRILYAPFLQPQKNITVRQMQLKKASTLILGAFIDPSNSSNQIVNRKREKELLVESVKSFLEKDRFPFIFCQPLGSAQEVLKALTDEGIPVSCHPSITRINRVYELAGIRLGKHKVLTKHTGSSVVLLPKEGRLRSNRVFFESERHPTILVDDGFGQTQKAFSLFSEENQFRLNLACDVREMKDIILAVNPKQVLLFGPFSKLYSKEITTYFKSVTILNENHQPALF